MTNLSRFDQSKVEWQPLPDVDHVWLSILNVDDTAKIVDVLFKFSANDIFEIFITNKTNMKNFFILVKILFQNLQSQGPPSINLYVGQHFYELV